MEPARRAAPRRGEPAVAHLQAVDRSSTPTRRPGRVEMRLIVAPEHRRQRIGSRLLERALAFAEEREARYMTAGYFEHSPAEPGMHFLQRFGFAELQR